MKVTKNINAEFLVRAEKNEFDAVAFTDNNYAVKAMTYEPRVTFIYSSLLRTQTGFQRIHKLNALHTGAETADIKGMYAETKWNVSETSALNARINYQHIEFAGKNNSSVSYIMLNGLMPGKNFFWTFDLTKRVYKNFELLVQYEGRHAGTSRTVNIGRASVRAVF